MIENPKKQNSENSNRSSRNVGKVVSSREMALKNSKRLFWAKVSLISFSLNFGTQEGSPKRPAIGALFSHGENGRHRFFRLTLSRLVVLPRHALLQTLSMAEAS